MNTIFKPNVIRNRGIPGAVGASFTMMGGSVESTYTAIRSFTNGNVSVNLSGGSVEGGVRGIWSQYLGSPGTTSELIISGGTFSTKDTTGDFKLITIEESGTNPGGTIAASVTGGEMVSENPVWFDAPAGSGVTVPVFYNLTYDPNGSFGTSINVLASGFVTVRQNLSTRDDFTFKAWNTASDGSGTSFSPGDTIDVENDTILYAIWADASETGGDGSGSNDAYVFAGIMVTLFALHAILYWVIR